MCLRDGFSRIKTQRRKTRVGIRSERKEKQYRGINRNRKEYATKIPVKMKGGFDTQVGSERWVEA